MWSVKIWFEDVRKHDGAMHHCIDYDSTNTLWLFHVGLCLAWIFCSAVFRFILHIIEEIVDFSQGGMMVLGLTLNPDG